MMMNERARGRKEESSRRRRRHSLSFTAYFFAALACLIQLPNSIEAGCNKRDGTGCTNQIETGNVNSYEGDCAGKTWEFRNIWQGVKENYRDEYGVCTKDCGGGTQVKSRKYDYYRITNCETKDKNSFVHVYVWNRRNYRVHVYFILCNSFVSSSTVTAVATTVASAVATTAGKQRCTDGCYWRASVTSNGSRVWFSNHRLR